MNAMIPLRKGKARAVAAVLIVATALAAVPAGAGQRKGARVMIAMRAGGPVEGELIAVKPSSLLIVDPSGGDRSLALADIRSVTVIRRSKAGIGGTVGLVAGAVGGYFIGYASAVASGACPDCEAPLSGYGIGFLGGLFGLAIGVAVGGASGRDVVVPLGGLSEAGQAAQLKKLRQYARVVSPL
jgi:hypothetical protein